MRWAAAKPVIDDINYIFSFGKWEGFTLSTVLEEDPEYLYWLEGQGILEFSTEISDLITSGSWEAYMDKLKYDMRYFPGGDY